MVDKCTAARMQAKAQGVAGGDTALRIYGCAALSMATCACPRLEIDTRAPRPTARASQARSRRLSSSALRAHS